MRHPAVPVRCGKTRGGLLQSKQTIRGLAELEPDVWADLYDRHARDVWRFIYRRTNGNAAVADDLASETFLAAVESVAGFDPDRGTVSQWLFGIARRKLADHMRRRVRLRLVGEPLEDTPAPAIKPSYDAERIHDALADLPPTQRDVLNWMYRDNLTVRQIAQRINRSEKAVENLLYRARQRFRARFESSHHTGTHP